MSKKLTQEEFIEQAIKVHHGKYTYEKVIYTQRTSKIIVTCPIHGDFVQMAGEHLKGVGCAKCAKDAQRLTSEQFISKSNKVHGNKFDYSKVIYILTTALLLKLYAQFMVFLNKGQLAI